MWKEEADLIISAAESDGSKPVKPVSLSKVEHLLNSADSMPFDFSYVCFHFLTTIYY
jgi:hypothetical protein